MNCRIVTAALLATLLAACGPESEEAGDLDLVGSQVSGVTQVASSQDPIPARNPVAPVAGQAMVLTPVNVGGTLMLVPTAVNPTDPRSTSQDPIPARNPVTPRASSQDPIPARTPGDPLGVAVEPATAAPQNPAAPRI